jgi:TonB family protein
MALCPMISASTLIDASKKWEGRLVDGRFPLRQWLGGSDHSVVFLTERSGAGKAVIKLIAVSDHSASNHEDENRLSRWAVTARISHPNLIRLFEFGRCQIEDDRFLFVVMEYAEENLGQIVPQRQLAPAEVAEMLPPIIEALSFLHEQGFVHGGIKPSNIFAVENRVKISADNLHHIGERGDRQDVLYSAPEAAASLSPASDVWSVGMLLITVLSNLEPGEQEHHGAYVPVPGVVPEPYRTIAQHSLRTNPEERCKLNEILPAMQRPPIDSYKHESPKHSALWLWVAVLAGIVVLALLFARIIVHRQNNTASDVPPTPAQPTESQSPPAAPPKLAPQGVQHGSVLHQVQPDVSRQAQNTIHGRVKVVVEVSVDAAGNVAQAKLVSSGPSRYFAAKALASSRDWKFTPPQVDGQPSASTWTLRFEFGRSSTEVIPKESKP